MVQVGRGMPANKEAIFKYMTEKEENMKLKWYYKNQQKLIDEAKRQLARYIYVDVYICIVRESVA